MLLIIGKVVISTSAQLSETNQFDCTLEHCRSQFKWHWWGLPFHQQPITGKPHLRLFRLEWTQFNTNYNLQPYPTIVQPNFNLVWFFKSNAVKNALILYWTHPIHVAYHKKWLQVAPFGPTLLHESTDALINTWLHKNSIDICNMIPTWWAAVSKKFIRQDKYIWT